MITPPHAQLHCEESSSTGAPPIVTPEDPGVQGLSTGKHGCGARLAAATCGLAGELHRPNGGTLLAALSVTTPAAAVADTSTPEAAKVDGAAPNEHASNAPVDTWLGIDEAPYPDCVTAPSSSSAPT